MSASYPNFVGKHAEEAIFGPADFIAYLRRVGAIADYQAPAGIVLCYQRALYQHVLQAEGLKPPERRGGSQGLLLLPSTAGRIGLLGQFGIGAPAAAAVLEELAAIGTSAFVSVGTAGSLQRDLRAGDLVLCEAAIRDEGVSHHYLPPAKLATAPAAMTAAMRAAMSQAGVPFRTGTSWTIDTPYRETVAEARRYQAEGVLCVEMEAAALFAVAEVRGLQVASAFAISDSLADLVWNPQFHTTEVEAGLITLYEAALNALSQPLGGSPPRSQPLGGQPPRGQPLGGQLPRGQPLGGQPPRGQPNPKALSTGRPPPWLGLPADWLNDAVRGFMPGTDPDGTRLPGVRGIEITTASPRYLLAMKLMAMRFGEDDKDIELLLAECGIRTAEEALALLEDMYPHQQPPLKTKFFLEELLGPVESE